ncbi:unnamed protein product, partial [Prorocentrum cordatum]
IQPCKVTTPRPHALRVRHRRGQQWPHVLHLLGHVLRVRPLLRRRLFHLLPRLQLPPVLRRRKGVPSWRLELAEDLQGHDGARLGGANPLARL